ncbi:integrase [Sputnik virophage]|uniref:Putative integrase V10 n=3 Tax=Mimivirus-dependent virus Sputnik TaxID=1932927 RepID=V10_SPTNK|nr:integrase [Sputnik virophage]B4YNF0.1 RecName: Full=Putative integrase V10 [Sputnik virophage]AFH75264.1 hypothetical protein Sputnik2_L10 [Sputnik virophage 2]AFH75284.1 hypothetical protein Sputnik3_L10 [Sputnik virophage 3]UMZ08522.1 putative Tyr recombinase family integrase [Mimivirus-dependent virus Sputnik]VAV82192.1 putative integrase [Guarani virophage]ACF16994.1 V10 [Sputnik virophage]
MPKYTDDDIFDDGAPQVAKGFDRGIDYLDIAAKLKKGLKKNYKVLQDTESTANAKRFAGSRVIYIIIALLQLKNCSRISEAIVATKKFSVSKNLNERVVVKIAKSEKDLIDRKTKDKIHTKPRYRDMVFPVDLVDTKIFKYIVKTKYWTKFCEFDSPRKRVLDFLLGHYECNTHSLRYAGINYLLNVEKRDMNVVAKFVGHANVNQLVLYTQTKALDEIFDRKIVV